jgi:hypothetical protein
VGIVRRLTVLATERRLAVYADRVRTKGSRRVQVVLDNHMPQRAAGAHRAVVNGVAVQDYDARWDEEATTYRLLSGGAPSVGFFE